MTRLSQDRLPAERCPQDDTGLPQIVADIVTSMGDDFGEPLACPELQGRNVRQIDARQGETKALGGQHPLETFDECHADAAAPESRPDCEDREPSVPYDGNASMR